jgi:DNA repair protein RadC
MKNFNNPHTSIKDWSEDDRPREKMISMGAEALSSAEILAILINNGTRSKSALDLAKELLGQNGNSLHSLSRMTLKDLQAIKGIGPAKAVTIKAALQLAVKKEQEILMRETVKSSKDILDYLRKRLAHENREHFIVMYLNRRNRVVAHEVLSSGGITGTVVDTRLLIRRALEEHATALILSHNHPSGNYKPSPQDKDLTKKIKSAAALFDISILDHVIVSDEGYYSFADEGEL